MTPRDLMIHELRDLYSAETQLVRALPRMTKAATEKRLAKAFDAHLRTTKKQVDRLEKIFRQLKEKPGGKKCLAMEGLINEAKELLQEDFEGALLDMALIGAAQKVEHYEIAGYGTARTLAELSGEEKTAKILQQTLDEEGDMDKRLTEVALDLSFESELDDE